MHNVCILTLVQKGGRVQVPKCNGDEEGMAYLYDVVNIDIQ